MQQIRPAIRAFLSHSSQDKRFVQQVFSDLGPTLAELDEATFEPAKFNHDAILSAFDRCAAFVLFASQASLTSSWVATEIKEALSRLRDRRLHRLLVFCPDKATFNLLDPELKHLNIVRVEKTPLVCARQIRGILAELFAEQSQADVSIARDENLAELKRLVIDPSKNYRTLAISGFDRIGRRSLVRNFCRDVYSGFMLPQRSIIVDQTYSCDDIYRQLIALQHGEMQRKDIALKFVSFSKISEADQIKLIGQEIRAIHDQREFVQFIDTGGLLADDGDFSIAFQAILQQNADLPDLIHILVLFRNAPDWVRKKYPNIAFYRLAPMTDGQTEIAIAHELKKRRAILPREQVMQLVGIIDGHPANLDYIVGYIFHDFELNPIRLQEVLDHSEEFSNWKRTRADAYIGNFNFAPNETLIVGLLIRYRALPSEALARLTQSKNIDLAGLGSALARLLDLNVIDVNGGEYRLIRPLRDALERNSTFAISAQQSDEFARILVDNLESYSEDDSVPISLIDSATVASIRSNGVASGWAHQFVLPSHYIWLARERYHRRDYHGALDYSRKALQLKSLITLEARLEALRFAGLSCARLGLQHEFSETIIAIEKIKHKRAKGIRWFLAGLNHRLNGELMLAQDALIKAASIMKGSIDVQRDLISVLLARRNFSEALTVAEGLVQRADNNAYVLDGYIQARIAASPNVETLSYDSDFTHRLSQLKELGDGPGLSFYSLRQVDLSLKKHDVAQALKFADEAVANTPWLPAAHAAKVRALIADKNYDKAWTELQFIEEMGNKRGRVRDGVERLALYEVRFEYNLHRKRFDRCKIDVENMAKLDPQQAKFMKMDVVSAVSKSKIRLDTALVAWLKS